jgi:hypothetical protein
VTSLITIPEANSDIPVTADNHLMVSGNTGRKAIVLPAAYPWW